MKTYLLAATVLLTATGPLQAQEPEGGWPTTSVSYADLDLTSAEGRSVLDRRLRSAARTVCRATAPVGPLAWISRNRCQRATVALARRTAAAAAAEAERLLLAQRGAAR